MSKAALSDNFIVIFNYTCVCIYLFVMLSIFGLSSLRKVVFIKTEHSVGVTCFYLL